MKISEATKESLQKETLSNIETLTSLVDSIRNGIYMIDKTENFSRERNIGIPDENHHLRRFSEYSMLLGLIWLDITTAFRVYLNAKENYETIYATKQLVIIINEGFKKIYNYVGIDDKGNPLTRARNDSFWIKDVGGLVTKELPYLCDDYDQITLLLDSYDDQELKDLKEPRNLFVHYDDEPSKVYDFLKNLDIEKITIKTIPFMDILSKMVNFGHTLQIAYGDLIESRKNNVFDDFINKFEAFRPQMGDNKNGHDLLDQINRDLKRWRNL